LTTENAVPEDKTKGFRKAVVGGRPVGAARNHIVDAVTGLLLQEVTMKRYWQR
jgi:hypothetical protein